MRAVRVAGEALLRGNSGYKLITYSVSDLRPTKVREVDSAPTDCSCSCAAGRPVNQSIRKIN